MGFGFENFVGGWLGEEKNVPRPFGLKCTPLEPAPHNHVGPTDASKGHSSHGEHDGSWGEHGHHKTRYPSVALCFGERQDKTKQKEGKTRT